LLCIMEYKASHREAMKYEINIYNRSSFVEA